MKKRDQNTEIRTAITRAGLFDYMVAKRLQITETELHKWLQEPLSADRRDRILRAIRFDGKPERCRSGIKFGD